jgi:hypothetical protein
MISIFINYDNHIVVLTKKKVICQKFVEKGINTVYVSPCYSKLIN